MPIPTCTPLPPTVSRRRHLVLAAEPRPAYRSTPTAAPVAGTDDTGTPHGRGTGIGDGEVAGRGDATVDATGAPFGLPVLAELSALAGVLERLTVADRAMLDTVAAVADLLTAEVDEVAAVSGVPLEQWVGIVARQTRMDRRLLLRAARLTVRFPALRDAIAAERLSWAQLRGLTLTLRTAPAVLDDRLDTLLADLLAHLHGADPDALLRQLERALVEWTAQLAPDADDRPAANRLVLQPRLDGTGGTVAGEYDAVGLALLDDATAPTRAQLDHPGGVGGAWADNLLTRLTHTCPPPTDPRGAGADRGGRAEGAIGTPHDPGGPASTSDHTGDDTAAGQLGGPLPPVKLLLRCELDALLDATRTPAALLTRLVGGSLRLSSAAARRLLEVHGAELRTVIVEQGEVLGVGRITRIPPGWLRDATLAVHDTCTGPLCDRPARTADLDHATPWWPTHPDDPPGGTDLANLGPLCATTNRTKETAGWRAHQHPDGRRTWTHPRTGLTITTIPATWCPPPGGTDPP
jgi:hypothetical protein